MGLLERILAKIAERRIITPLILLDFIFAYSLKCRNFRPQNSFSTASAISRLTPLLEKHPDKTFIGRIERGFDFLGYHFGQEGLSVAKTTIENFVVPAIRLYEREPGEACASARLGSYVRRWVGWTAAGLAVADVSTPIGAAAG